MFQGRSISSIQINLNRLEKIQTPATALAVTKHKFIVKNEFTVFIHSSIFLPLGQ